MLELHAGLEPDAHYLLRAWLERGGDMELVALSSAVGEIVEAV